MSRLAQLAQYFVNRVTKQTPSTITENNVAVQPVEQPKVKSLSSQQKAIKRIVEFFNGKGYKTIVSGSHIWVGSDTHGINCIVVDFKGDIKDYTETSSYCSIPFLSCPLSLLTYTNLLPSNNVEWRLAVQQYWDKMNPKLKKGKRYEVFGNNTALYVDVEKITRSNVFGKFLGNNVSVSKLSIGQEIKPQNKETENVGTTV